MEENYWAEDCFLGLRKNGIRQNAPLTKGSNCPYCAERLAIEGVIDLATVNPSLASQWHPTKMTICFRHR